MAAVISLMLYGNVFISSDPGGTNVPVASMAISGMEITGSYGALFPWPGCTDTGYVWFENYNTIVIPDYDTATCYAQITGYYQDGSCNGQKTLTLQGQPQIARVGSNGQAEVSCRVTVPCSMRDMCAINMEYYARPQNAVLGIVSITLSKSTVPCTVDYCEGMPHAACTGSWQVSGAGEPDCSCSWACSQAPPPEPPGVWEGFVMWLQANWAAFICALSFGGWC